jgi:transcriptional regulator with XRE-family HTH domain
MAPDELVRAARRHAGLSQRALAARAGVSLSAVVAVESGQRAPSMRVVQAILTACELDLALDRPAPELCRHVLAHLRLSLSARLHLALGGGGRPYYERALPPWAQLATLASDGAVFLTGSPAVRLWLPGLPVEDLIPVGLEPHDVDRLPATPALAVGIGQVPSNCTVGVPLALLSLRTPTPLALSLQPECAPWRPALRAVASLLDRAAATDSAGRRPAAHREPRRDEEAGRLLYARRWGSRFRPPDPLDGRGWRLNDDAGMRAWIEHRARRG